MCVRACVHARARINVCVRACMCVCVLWYDKLLNNDNNSHGCLTFSLISSLNGIFGYYFELLIVKHKRSLCVSVCSTFLSVHVNM